jgi:hypothetical protein
MDEPTTPEITPELNGRTILFDFLAPGDVVDVLKAVADYLQMGRPEPPPGQDCVPTTDQAASECRRVSPSDT